MASSETSDTTAPSSVRRVLVVVTVVALVGGSLLVIQSSRRATSETGRIEIDASSGLSGIPFELAGEPKVRKAIGHAHGPFMFGSDSYEYDGEIEFLGKRVRIVCTSFAPRALVELSGNFYLLAQGAFDSNQNRFKWYVSSNSHEFEPVRSGDIPAELWRIRFVGATETRFYRTDLLRALTRESTPDKTKQCFDVLFSEDPNFGFTTDWELASGRIGNLMGFLSAIEPSKDQGVYLAIAEKLLSALRPMDDPLVAGSLCSVVEMLDPIEGHRKLCGYRSKWMREALQRDERLNPFMPPGRLSSLRCEELSRKTTTTTTSRADVE